MAAENRNVIEVRNVIRTPLGDIDLGANLFFGGFSLKKRENRRAGVIMVSADERHIKSVGSTSKGEPSVLTFTERRNLGFWSAESSYKEEPLERIGQRIVLGGGRFTTRVAVRVG